MLKLPEPKFNGHEVAADVTLPFLSGVCIINLHGEIKHGEVASEPQLKGYRSLTSADFPPVNKIEGISSELLSEKWYSEYREGLVSSLESELEGDW